MNDYSLQNYVVQLLGLSQKSAQLLSEVPKKWVVFLIGPIGSGKGTQAELLSEKFGLTHIETSKLLEEKFNNADASDSFLAEQKNLWKSGILNKPEFVLEIVIDKIKELQKHGLGIIFSASPRTLFEAEGELPILEDLFGKDSIRVIHIKLGEEESIKRNSHRRICKTNRHPIPNFPQFKNITTCPRDGSELITRALDDPQVIKVRYQEYLNRTEPILFFLKDRGYGVIEINGEQAIDKVFKDILEKING